MLAELREARGLTPGDLGRRVGLYTRTIQQAELHSGAFFPPETIDGILRVFDDVKKVSDEERDAVRKPSVEAQLSQRFAATDGANAADAPKPVLAEVLSEMAEAAAKDGTVERTNASGQKYRVTREENARLDEVNRQLDEAAAAAEAPPSPRAAVCTRPEPSPLTVSYTSVGLMLRGLRLERRMPVLDLAALACMPEEVVMAAEVAGPIAPHLMERLLHALDDAFPLSAEQRELFREEVEMSRPWAGPRKGDRPAGVPLTRWDRALFAEARAKRDARTDPLSGRVEERA